jgi:two-component sensor histidine kinase
MAPIIQIMRFTAALLYPIASSNALTLAGVPRLRPYILTPEHRERNFARSSTKCLSPICARIRGALTSRDPRFIGSENGPCPSMALHGLATNAAKCGMLSAPSGRVATTWSLTPGDPVLLTFHWQEQDDPLVSPPARQRFGSWLIERSLAQELAGEVQITYASAGVACQVMAPLSEKAALSVRQAKAVA